MCYLEEWQYLCRHHIIRHNACNLAYRCDTVGVGKPFVSLSACKPCSIEANALLDRKCFQRRKTRLNLREAVALEKLINDRKALTSVDAKVILRGYMRVAHYFDQQPIAWRPGRRMQATANSYRDAVFKLDSKLFQGLSFYERLFLLRCRLALSMWTEHSDNGSVEARIGIEKCLIEVNAAIYYVDVARLFRNGRNYSYSLARWKYQRILKEHLTKILNSLVDHVPIDTLSDHHDRICVICGEEMSSIESHVFDGSNWRTSEAPVRLINCANHQYGKQCLLQWLKISQTCPVCRASYKDIIQEIRIENEPVNPIEDFTYFKDAKDSKEDDEFFGRRVAQILVNNETARGNWLFQEALEQASELTTYCQAGLE